jgi:simple sugar transport system permease protein
MWIVASGVLFGALEAGAAGMQRDASVPAVIVYVIEAGIIIGLVLLDARRRVVSRESWVVRLALRHSRESGNP